MQQKEESKKKKERYTFTQFQKEYPDDHTCLEKIFDNQRNEPCPGCNQPTEWKHVKGRKSFRCSHCHHQHYPLKGTIFEKTRTPLTLWLYVAFLMSATRNGISSKEVQRLTGVTYKTAFRMTHLIRDRMGLDEVTTLEGEIQADETFVGGKNKNRHKDKKVPKSQGRSHIDKAPVLGIMETGGKVIAKVVPDVKRETLQEIVRSVVVPGATVVSDEWNAYRGLDDIYDHRVIYHSRKQYQKDGFTTNSIEGFWAYFKRMVHGTHIKMSKEYMQNYVNEAAFRYNNGQKDRPCFSRVFELASYRPV